MSYRNNGPDIGIVIIVGCMIIAIPLLPFTFAYQLTGNLPATIGIGLWAYAMIAITTFGIRRNVNRKDT